MNNTILVPYDFTEEADCALNHALRVAKSNNTSVVINHIVDKKTLSRLKSEKKTIADLEADLTSIANKHSSADVTVTTLVEEGDIFISIPVCAEKSNSNLIVFGTHGVKGMQHILGAFALKLVTSARVPVVIVQRRPIRENGYSKIVFPVDENPYSKQKAYAVSDFAKLFNAEVLVFPKKNTDDHCQNYTKSKWRYSQKVFEENNVKFTIGENSKTGSFSKLVVDFAAKNDADLIAIITQDSEDLDVGDIFLGSEDIKIINNDAEIPTLCINAIVSMKVGGLAGVTST